MLYVDITGAPTTADAPTVLTPEMRRRLLSSPIHRRIRHYAHATLALGILGGLANVVGLVLGAVWAKHILQENRWLIFTYSIAAVFSLLWAVYSFIFVQDVKKAAFPDTLQIDIGWISFANVFLDCFLVYLYRKMLTYGVLDIFDVACSSGCSTKLQYVRISPLVFAITSFVFGCIQLLLSVLLWYNPILNPPLDTEGNPVPQDPETGRPLPLDANGKPIEPAWLRPPPSTTSTQQSAGAGRNGKGDEPPASGGGSDDEEAGGGEEKKLLGSVKPEQDLYAVGKQGKRSSHRRERKRR